MTKPSLRVGLIGIGFMGKAHVFDFTSAPRVFDLPYDLELHTVADITPAAAEEAARRLGFAHAIANWRGIIEVARFINAVAGAPELFNFRNAPRIQRLIETIQTSNKAQAWADVA